MSDTILDYSIPHARIRPILHPRLGVEVNGRSAVRYVRFLRQVRLDRLELPYSLAGRNHPRVPTHPAHLVISVLDRKTNAWRTVREVDVPENPRIRGEGLNQRMTMPQMNAHFAKVLQEPPIVIPMHGLRTDHLRVECDREHPVFPNHIEMSGGPQNVPFAILHPLRAIGSPGKWTTIPVPAVQPVLRQRTIQPAAPREMKVERKWGSVMFASDQFSIGFSLRRPILTHVGWDAFDQGRAGENRLLFTNEGTRHVRTNSGVSGPLIRTLNHDCMPFHFTGEVSVRGNRVEYRDLQCNVEGLRIDATFIVEANGVTLELAQHAKKDIPVIEGDAWRWVWDLRAGMTGAAAVPTLRPGRSGDVQAPFMWASDGVGCLSCEIVNVPDDKAHVQIESYRASQSVAGGCVLGAAPAPNASQVLPKGITRATWRWSVSQFEPAIESRNVSSKLDPGIQRHWSSMYSCYRPEWGGFSNHAVSINCHVNQWGPAEMVTVTRKPKLGPSPLEMYRFTIERAMLDGSGYGYHRNLYHDSDPVLVSGAGRIHQADPNLAWLRRIEPGLLEAVQRMLASIGREGLGVCRDLSGNSRSFRWSTNLMDCMGFGHIDAYSNAWTYRGLRNAAAMLEDLGRHDLSKRCRETARELRAAYPKHLINPKTGWVAGWKSRDGKLHDAAFTWINGVACAFGLLDKSVAKKALSGLEQLREKVGATPANCGIPFNLLPVNRDDHMLPQMLFLGVWPSAPTFEFFTDGAMSGTFAVWYLRALAINGLKERAKTIAKEMSQGYAEGMYSGPEGSGVEFRSWEGLPAAYEGTFVTSFSPLYAIAIEQGLIKPTSPEWWPANG